MSGVLEKVAICIICGCIKNYCKTSKWLKIAHFIPSHFVVGQEFGSDLAG